MDIFWVDNENCWEFWTCSPVNDSVKINSEIFDFVINLLMVIVI